VAEWITANLVDPATGLVWDGLRVAPDGSVRVIEKAVYSYCQGVYLGICVELASRTGDAAWLRRAGRTVSAAAEHLADANGVLRCHGSGDGGLFTGILCRYLGLAAAELPESEMDTRRLAARLVTASAGAAWRHRRIVDGGPRFGPEWSDPDHSTAPDLSVQLSAWMLCEAAALVERRAPSLV
jgi:predicted alpha-1,6-mannanase (GH76 family)